MADRIPRAVLPLRDEYLTVSEIIDFSGHSIYNMTKQEFVAVVMKVSNGFFNPTRAEQIYLDLMEDAGLPPLESK